MAEEAANTAAERVAPAKNKNVVRMALLLTRLSDDVDQHGFAHLDRIHAAFDCDRQILRIGDWTDPDMTQGFRELRVIDVRIPDCCADMRILDAALAPIGHALKMHDLLMVGAVVPHDGEHRNLMMRRRPERAWGIHGVAVVLDVDAKALVRCAMRERGAHRCRQTVADASSPGSTDELMMLVEGPQTMRPVGEAGIAGHERPVFVLDLLPNFGRETGRADRARIPRIGCGLRGHALGRPRPAFLGLVATFGDFRAAIGRY